MFGHGKMQEGRVGELMRMYRHPACGGETAVSGAALWELANPLAPPILVQCATCGKTGRTDEFIWTHTNETIDKALERLRRGLPWHLRLAKGATFLVLLNLLSVGAGVAVGNWDRWWTGTLAGYVSAVALLQLNIVMMDRLTPRYQIQFEQSLLGRTALLPL
jgi:hypothetical protein